MKRKARKRKLLPLISFAHVIGAGAARGENSDVMDPGPPIHILGIAVNSETKQITLRWNSKFESSYLIEESTNPKNGWVQAFSGIAGEAKETTFSVPGGTAQTKFFRVREMTFELKESANPESREDLKLKGASSKQTLSAKEPATGSSNLEYQLEAAETPRKEELQRPVQPSFNHNDFG